MTDRPTPTCPDCGSNNTRIQSYQWYGVKPYKKRLPYWQCKDCGSYIAQSKTANLELIGRLKKAVEKGE